MQTPPPNLLDAERDALARMDATGETDDALKASIRRRKGFEGFLKVLRRKERGQDDDPVRG